MLHSDADLVHVYRLNALVPFCILDLHINRTKLGISIRMEISIIVLLFQAVWKFQYGFEQIIDHVFVRALAMPSCFVS